MNNEEYNNIFMQNVSLTTEYINNFFESYIKRYNFKNIDFEELKNKIFNGTTTTIKLNDFYNYVSDTCMHKSTYHPEYAKLGSVICMDKLHMTTPKTFYESAVILHNNYNYKKNIYNSIINDDIFKIIEKNKDKIENEIKHENDYFFDYFGIKTLERSYLLKAYVDTKKQIIERPQYLIMRLALTIHKTNLEKVFETYNLISNRYFTHATPTLFNAGTMRQQLSSCFLLGIDDNIENILLQIGQIGIISKWAGGIGIHLSSIRSMGSDICGTNGISNGIIPLCIFMDKEAKYINQGGKRPGSIACYLEPWHADVFDFCSLRLQNSGTEDTRARDLFLALWIPDLFMKRVENDEIWSLMCPNECKNLNKVHSEEFEKLYISYESKGQYKKQIKARELWKHIMSCQIESGFPYMLYKDSINKKCNQKNLGTICSSNLCCEITEYSDGQETAVCNLASICLPKFIENGTYNYEKLEEVTRVIVNNLNKLIDVNYYPSENAKKSNLKNRPIGIGIQGLADVYNILDIPFNSTEAEKLNKLIFETIYYASISESNKLAIIYGPYDTFDGSPFSEGKLQFHLWNVDENDLSGRYDWKQLTENVMMHGTRNSLLTSLMPTASTSQIMSCSEGFEPIMSNLYIRTTMAGEFVCINENLIKKLIEKNIWNDDIRKLIIINNGSIQNIKQIPNDIKNVFKTAYEIPLQSIIKQSCDRGIFIDQSQSMNLFMKEPNFDILNSAHFYGWSNGIKTGMYYLRTSPAVNPIHFGIDVNDILRLTETTSIINLITDEYGFSDSNKEMTTSVKKSCKYKKGQAPSDCEACSS
jgi:ribonucleoside-diphosphate reductase alpha chain